MKTRSAAGSIDLRFWYLPDWLYEAWPFIHVLGGTTLLVTLDGSPGTSSGVLLIMAGLVMFTIRGWHRSNPVAGDVDGSRTARRAGIRARSYYNDPAG